MVSLIITMLMILFYAVISPNEINSEFNDQNRIMPETKYFKNYEQLKSPENTAVIYPIFTQNAYNWNSFHDFYLGRCDCLTADIDTRIEKLFAASGNGFSVLEFLGYYIIDDIQVDKNPKILEKFDKIILLHNEFVTKSEFEAINAHPNVVFLYPNALSSEISANYTNNTLTLLRGPGFPDESIQNAFNWKYDNTHQMKDWECKDWEFNKIDNGYMLNCYPEHLLINNGFSLLQKIKDL